MGHLLKCDDDFHWLVISVSFSTGCVCVVHAVLCEMCVSYT